MKIIIMAKMPMPEMLMAAMWIAEIMIMSMVMIKVSHEGPATNSGHRNRPRHIPDFEKNQLFYLRPDLPHSWLFPAHS